MQLYGVRMILTPWRIDEWGNKSRKIYAAERITGENSQDMRRPYRNRVSRYREQQRVQNNAGV